MDVRIQNPRCPLIPLPLVVPADFYEPEDSINSKDEDSENDRILGDVKLGSGPLRGGVGVMRGGGLLGLECVLMDGVRLGLDRELLELERPELKLLPPELRPALEECPPDDRPPPVAALPIKTPP